MHRLVHWLVHGMVHGCMVVGVLPGLVRLGLGIGGVLDGDGKEVVGVVSGCEIIAFL